MTLLPREARTNQNGALGIKKIFSKIFPPEPLATAERVVPSRYSAQTRPKFCTQLTTGVSFHRQLLMPAAAVTQLAQLDREEKVKFAATGRSIAWGRNSCDSFYSCDSSDSGETAVIYTGVL